MPALGLLVPVAVVVLWVFMGLRVVKVDGLVLTVVADRDPVQ